MHQRLKRWESPRKEGRNDKGRGGAARARQLKKKTQMLRQKLKESDGTNKNNKQGEKLFSLFLYVFTSVPSITEEAIALQPNKL